MMEENEMATAEYASSETMVWWDINNCPIPNGIDPGLVGPIIESALRKLGYSGLLTIKAIGNLNAIPEETLRELSSSGIALRHARCRLLSISADMDKWREENPAKVSIMLISHSDGVGVLSAFIADLKANTLLAYPITPRRLSPRLMPSAQWLWNSLLNDGLAQDTPVVEEERDAASTTMFCCVPCCFDCQTFDEFAVHIGAQGHSEIANTEQLGQEVVEEEEEEEVEASPAKKAGQKLEAREAELRQILKLEKIVASLKKFQKKKRANLRSRKKLKKNQGVYSI